MITEGTKPVVVVPMMFASESHGYVTVCHGDECLTSGSVAALDEVDRVLTAHFDTKILLRLRRHLGAEQFDGAHKAFCGNPTANRPMTSQSSWTRRERRRRSRRRRRKDGETSTTNWSRTMRRLSGKLQAQGSAGRSTAHRFSLRCPP